MRIDRINMTLQNIDYFKIIILLIFLIIVIVINYNNKYNNI